MRLIERLGAFFHQPEEEPKSKTAKSLSEFIGWFESGIGGIVYIQPAEITENGRKIYSLNYSADAANGTLLLFREIFNGLSHEKDLHFRNFITAIDRVEFLGQIANIDACVAKDGHLSDSLDPNTFPRFRIIARERGIVPFPQPMLIPQVSKHAPNSLPQPSF